MWPSHTTPYSHGHLGFCYSSRRARALHTIRHAILMLTIDCGKATQLRDRNIPNCPRAFPPIRRTHLTMLILHPPYVSATHHI